MQQGKNKTKKWKLKEVVGLFLMPIFILIIIGLVEQAFWSTGTNSIYEKREAERMIKRQEADAIKMQKKAAEISDWKIYKNEKYGFELRYPKELNYSESEISENVQQSAVGGGEVYFGPEIFTFRLGKNDVADIDDVMVISVIKRENDNPLSQLGPWEGYSWGSSRYSGSYYFENNGYIYVASSLGGDSYYDSIFEKILSTFKDNPLNY